MIAYGYNGFEDHYDAAARDSAEIRGLRAEVERLTAERDSLARAVSGALSARGAVNQSTWARNAPLLPRLSMLVRREVGRWMSERRPEDVKDEDTYELDCRIGEAVEFDAAARIAIWLSVQADAVDPGRPVAKEVVAALKQRAAEIKAGEWRVETIQDC